MPEPRAARALPGALLPRRDDLHHLRHRDHLPVPVGGRSTASSGRSASGEMRRVRGRRSSSSFVYLVANGALDWGPVQAAAPRSTDAVVGRAHRRRRTDPPGRPRGSAATTDEAGGLMGSSRRPRRRPRGARPQLPHRQARGPRQVGARPAACWPATFGLACCAIEMMARRRRRTTTSPASAWRSSGPRPARPTS